MIIFNSGFYIKVTRNFPMEKNERRKSTEFDNFKDGSEINDDIFLIDYCRYRVKEYPSESDLIVQVP